MKTLIVLLQFLVISAYADSGPHSLHLDKNDPTRPEDTLEEYSLPEQHEHESERRQKEEAGADEKIEKEDHIQHTQNNQPNDDRSK